MKKQLSHTFSVVNTPPYTTSCSSEIFYDADGLVYDTNGKRCFAADFTQHFELHLGLCRVTSPFHCSSVTEFRLALLRRSTPGDVSKPNDPRPITPPRVGCLMPFFKPQYGRCDIGTVVESCLRGYPVDVKTNQA
jgi:hypothetical protein